MAITAFNYVAANIEDRSGDVLFGNGTFTDDTESLYLIGACNEITVGGTSRDTPADSHGRVYMKGIDLAISFNLMQTDFAAEFANVPDIVGNSDLIMKITDVAVNGADQAALTTAAHAASGVEFEGVHPRFDFTLDFNGGDSSWTINISGRLSIAQVKTLGITPIVMGSSGV